MAQTRIDVVGLWDFQRDLRALDTKLPRELRKANKAAAEIIAEATRASFSSRGGVAPKVAPSVRALAQQRSASVKIGGERTPYALGAEFGGGKYGKGNPKPLGGGYTTQFEPFRKGGYSLFPAIKDKREEVLGVYRDGIDDLVREAFPS